MIGIKLLERYEITGEVGHGGMGIVYRARDGLLGREVAVKMIPPRRLSPEAEKRFEREARIVARLDHPAIVPIYDFGNHHGSIFFVMPLVPGETLRSLVRHGTLSLGEMLEIVAQAADALEYSHSRGVIHGDVKPANFMVSRGRKLRVWLMDFGLARGTAGDNVVSESKAFAGTVYYMSPEQILQATVDHRSDVFSLGAVLYECLAGEPPFLGAFASVAYRIAHKDPPTLTERGVEVDAELEGIVLGCLAKTPAERPASAGELGAALSGYRRALGEGRRSTITLSPRLRVGYRAASAPLLGREEEWRRLTGHLDAAVAGKCQLAILEGDVGSGKSRLLHELESFCRGRGIRVLRGRIADHRALPFHGLCELIQDGLQSRGRTAVPDFSDLAPDLLACFPSLSEVEALYSSPPAPQGALHLQEPLAVPGQPQSSSTADRDPAYLFELLARTLARLADGEPLVVLLENLHDGEVSIEALDYIVRRLAATPLLIAGTCRPAEVGRGHPLHRLRPGLEEARRMSSIRLGPLHGGDFRRWLEWLIGADELADELVEELHDATEGNPFFSQELVRSLLENERIRRDQSGVWVLAGPPAGHQAIHGGRRWGAVLPATIHQAVQSRIDRLPDAERRILAAASVLGRSFDLRDLEPLAGNPRPAADLEAAIDGLIGRGLLSEEPRPRGDRLCFSSGVIRDVLYRSLPRRRRRRLHRRVGRSLERRFAGRLDAVYPRLVEHFAEGEVAGKTIRYALELARRLLAACSPEEARLAVRTARSFLEDVELDGVELEEQGVANREAVRGELLLIEARAHRDEGDLAPARERAGAAAQAFERSGDPARAAAAALLAAETAWQGRDGDRARRWVATGSELARRSGPWGAGGEICSAPWGAGGEICSGSVETLKRLLTLGATVANLKGEHPEARAYLEEVEALGPGSGGGEVLEPGGGLVTALANPVASLDPAEAKTVEEFEVAACVFETLLATDQAGDVAPALADGWRSSADRRTFELRLRPGVAFSDGRPLAAADVKASFERAARHAAASPVPALAAIAGFAAFAAGEADGIAGIEVRGEAEIVFRLAEPLPIFPALLTNLKTAVTATTRGAELVGSGPFRVRRRSRQRIVLERNPRRPRRSPLLDRLEFRTALDASAIAAALRRGEIDLARDLFPEDLEEILRDPRLRPGVVEATKKNVTFLLFNPTAGVTGNADVRRALAGVVRTRDLVWRTLGRFAQPAVSLIPPGIFGHDPGRRRQTLDRSRAADLLRRAAGGGIRLRAAIHPILVDRYSSLTQGLVAAWGELGVEVEVHRTTMEAFRARVDQSSGIDVLLSRWIADYDDPDNFTYELFHRRHGVLRRYFSSAEADRLLERARRETDPDLRSALYRRFEDLLAREHVLLPLFHDVDYRIAGPAVRGLRLKNTPPYVDYARLARGPEGSAPAPVSARRAATVRPRGEGGELRVPIASRAVTLDPAAGLLADHHEVSANVFETLTRVDDGARLAPWLAAAFESERGGRRWRFRLREARFHDGRRLTARDVRYSFERLLRAPRRDLHFPLLPIRGARALRAGETSKLAGFGILSESEFAVELERPLGFYPTLLSHPAAAVVAEDSDDFGGHWRRGANGTGPFRVVRFDHGERLVLDRHPDYWRPGLPKSDRLIFQFGLPPERIFEQLENGWLSLASGLRPADAEVLRLNPRYAAGFCQVPRLATCFLVPVCRGVLADRDLRRAFARALKVETAVKESLGRWVTPARGMIPPGLLGHEAPDLLAPPSAGGCAALGGLRLRSAMIPAFSGPFASFWTRLCRSSGARIEELPGEIDEVLGRARRGEVDVIALRWIVNYPDTDGFLGNLLHSEEGLLTGIFGSLELDRLIDQGRRETDPALRHSIYRRIDEHLVGENLLIPLFHEQSYRFRQPSVRGLRLGLTLPEVRYEELYVSR